MSAAQAFAITNAFWSCYDKERARLLRCGHCTCPAVRFFCRIINLLSRVARDFARDLNGELWVSSGRFGLM